jgi:hypothetical protein
MAVFWVVAPCSLVEVTNHSEVLAASIIRAIILAAVKRQMQPETSSAVTTPVKLDRLRKPAIRSQHKRTIYNVYKFFKDISEQPEHFSNMNVHIKYLKERRYQTI